MDSPSIHIYVEPPAEDQCGPLDLGDGPMVIDPPFDPINYQYSSDPFYESQPEYFEGYRKDIYVGSGNEGNENLNNQIDLATDHRPYPFGSLQYNAPRPPTNDYSPYSSTLGDDFSPTTSPSVHGGQLSPSHPNTDDILQSSLSPTQLNNLSLPFDELNLGHSLAFRVRSHSVTEPTVAPSDVWCDPAIYTGVRSAPPTTASLPDDTSSDCIISRSGCDLHQISSGILSPTYYDFLTSGHRVYPDVSAEMSSGQAECQDAGNALLFQTALYPPLSHKLDTQLSQHYTPHHRSNSDSSGFLSPTSPVDRRSDRMHHRKAQSVSGSIRHTPYSASAPSTPERAFGLSELSGAYPVQRRHSGPSSSRPKLSIYVAPSHEWNNQVLASPGQIHPAIHGGDQTVMSSYTSNDVGNPVQNEWNQESAPSPSLQLVQGMVEQPRMSMQDQLSPSSAISSTSPSMQKDIVGSQKIVDASTARRKRDSKFNCNWPNCHQTFTAKHNWKYHYLSHTGERPFPCGNCQDRFTTPGVANRHRAKCPGPEGSSKRRRSRSSTAPSRITAA